MLGKTYAKGVHDGLSIGLGYFSVSFSFGILAVKGGLSVFQSTLISMITVTSAGQFAGLDSILTGASLFALICTQIIINLRYGLMSLSLSQKLNKDVGTWKRCIIAFFNTDEIFAVAMGQKGSLGLTYMLGLATLPWLGWSSGTLVGAIAGEILPTSISSALGLALYGMFIAIVVPVATTSKPVTIVVILAALFSCIVFFLPTLKSFSIIICTITSAAVVAMLFPIEETEEYEDDNKRKLTNNNKLLEKERNE